MYFLLASIHSYCYFNLFPFPGCEIKYKIEVTTSQDLEKRKITSIDLVKEKIEINIQEKLKQQVETRTAMMALPAAPVFETVQNQSKARKSVSSNIQWPEFKVTQPDPILGKESYCIV